MTAFLQQYISPALPVILWLFRGVTAGLAVWLLVRCCKSLFRGRDRESWGFVTLSNGARYELYHWENVIGRARRADIRVNFPSVSRTHAILQRDDTGSWQVRQSVEGLGFAIPINDAIKVAQDLLENGYVSGRPYMGITYLAVTDAQTAAQLNVNAYGVYVVDVAQGGPADKAGLKTGDRIVSIDGTEIAQKDDLGTLIQQHAAGDTLSITVAREGQMQTVSLTLGEKNAQTQQAQKNS